MNRPASASLGSFWIASVIAWASPAAGAAADDSVYRRVTGAAEHALVLDATDATPSTRGEPRGLAPADAQALPTPRSGDRAIPFRAPAAGPDADNPDGGPAGPLVTMASSLAIVLGLFAAVTFLYRRSATASGGLLPGEAFVVLGKSPLGPRQNITLVRVGQRILVLAIGPGSTTQLSELTDPDEVAALTAICQSGGSRQTFQRTLHELGQEPPLGSGFVPSATPSPRRGLFASG